MPYRRARNHPRYRPDIIVEEVERLHCEEFLSTSQIAEIFQCDAQTIRRRLEETGSLHKHRRRIDITDKELLTQYNSGLGVVELSRRFHCRRATITKRLHRLGIENIRRIAHLGEKNPSWTGGRTKDRRGYIQVYAPGHPRAKNERYVYEHILVWEEAHGYPLPDGWVVHHINGKKDDNRPENLMGMPKKGHLSSLLLREVQKRLRTVEKELKAMRAQQQLSISGVD